MLGFIPLDWTWYEMTEAVKFADQRQWEKFAEVAKEVHNGAFGRKIGRTADSFTPYGKSGGNVGGLLLREGTTFEAVTSFFCD